MCFSVLKMSTQFVTYCAAGFPNELNWDKIQKLGCVSSELTIRSLLPDSLEACKRLHILENSEKSVISWNTSMKQKCMKVYS